MEKWWEALQTDGLMDQRAAGTASHRETPGPRTPSCSSLPFPPTALRLAAPALDMLTITGILPRGLSFYNNSPFHFPSI